MPGNRVRHVEAAAQIDADHVFPHLAAHLQDRAVAGDAGIVDHHIDRAQLGLDLGERPRAQASKSPTSHLYAAMPVRSVKAFAFSSLPA
jgi:uncharacterized protein (DUF952 family)